MQLHQVEQVDVVGVGLVSLRAELPAFLITAQPQQILGQLDACGSVVGGELQRLLLMSRPFREPVLLRQLPANQVVDKGILVPGREGSVAEKLRPALVVAQVGDHRAIGPRGRLLAVDGQHLVEHFQSVVILLGVDGVFGAGQHRGDVPMVVLEGHRHGMRGQRRFAPVQAARQPEVHVRVVGIFLECRLKDFGGQFEILLQQGQFAAGQHGITMLGVHLQGAVVKLFEDVPGIHPHVERGPPEGQQVVGIGIPPRGPTREVDDFGLPHRRLFGLTAHPRRFDADQPHPDAP